MGNPVGAVVLAAIGVAVGVGGTLYLSKGVPGGAAPKPAPMDIHAQILEATPARELVVMTADARVFSGAEKDELFAQKSKVYYVSRARFTYSVDMRALTKDSFKYDAASDVLKVRLPKVLPRADVYGPRERLASIAIGASEGGSGNALEKLAASELEKDAVREAGQPRLIKAAETSAKYEVGKLYEDAFRAGGRSTRVVVFSADEPIA